MQKGTNPKGYPITRRHDLELRGLSSGVIFICEAPESIHRLPSGTYIQHDGKADVLFATYELLARNNFRLSYVNGVCEQDTEENRGGLTCYV